MDTDIAIRMKGVKKKYKLGQIGGGSLQADLQSWWARKRGKEDPNSKIGTDQSAYGQTFMALDGIDLEVHRGEALGIIGRNGAGKSTLLKLLSRVTAPTEGVIDIYGRITSMLEVGTGFHPEMTGRENIYMNGAILGMTKAEIDSKMEQIIDFSEVRQFIDTPVKRYSSGMYVKLAFSVAAHLDSEIMIMDEVLAVGDMAFQQKCLHKMSDAAQVNGKTILYVSHNMNTIRQLCNRCIVLDKGKIIFDGDVEQAISLYMGIHDDNKISMNLDKKLRNFWVPHHSIHAIYAAFEGTESCSFETSNLILLLKWKNLENVENLCLRIEIWTMDGNTQGSYMLYDFYSGNQGTEGAVKIQLNIAPLCEGKYRMVYSFFVRDPFGNDLDSDIVEGLNFKKVSSPLSDRIIWRSKSWGHIELPHPVLIKKY